jgi:hypothetical protein
MANMELITSVTVGAGGAASVTLTAIGTIPQTYTDLKILMSVRSASGGLAYSVFMKVNNLTSSIYSQKTLEGPGNTTPYSFGQSGVNSAVRLSLLNGPTSTSNTFSNAEVYIPNYASSNYKSVSIDTVTETNAAEIYADLTAYLVSTTDPITSLTFTTEVSAGNFAEGSTFYLYGISKVTSTAKATGGIVSSDETYWYHMFPFSGTFTPTAALTADYLVIAGGGGGWVGGGGAGGYRTSIGGSPLSLTATSYSVTVGAGGAPQGGSGNNSIFSTITSTGGGAGAGGVTVYNGGSGGGGSNDATNYGTGNAGSYTPSEGNNGGSRVSSTTSGGGGGAGAVGGNASGTTGGAGGAGSNSASTWAIATQTGVNGYYAGGGGGGGVGGGGLSTSGGGLGGLGGGGNAEQGGVSGRPGVANTGSGGGGQYYVASTGNGGSGLVIIRYAK